MTPLECSNCATAASRPHWGGYSLTCARCCARLLWAARGDQNLWDTQMEAIKWFPERPPKKDIAAAYKALQAQDTNPPVATSSSKSPQGSLL